MAERFCFGLLGIHFTVLGFHFDVGQQALVVAEFDNQRPAAFDLAFHFQQHPFDVYVLDDRHSGGFGLE